MAICSTLLITRVIKIKTHYFTSTLYVCIEWLYMMPTVIKLLLHSYKNEITTSIGWLGCGKIGALLSAGGNVKRCKHLGKESGSSSDG